VVGACRVKSTYIEGGVNKSSVALAGIKLIGSPALFSTCSESLMELNSGKGEIGEGGWGGPAL